MGILKTAQNKLKGLFFNNLWIEIFGPKNKRVLFIIHSSTTTYSFEAENFFAVDYP
jgi:hypothetical protein